jgi:hypothetical protein
MPSHSSPRPARKASLPEAPSRQARETSAEYIAEMTAGLAVIAETAQLDLLTYFLKMAQMEAEAYLRAKD